MSSGNPAHLEVSIHNFKNNIARYIRDLEEGRYKLVIVRRYDQPAMVCIPYHDPDKPRKKDTERERDENPGPVGSTWS